MLGQGAARLSKLCITLPVGVALVGAGILIAQSLQQDSEPSIETVLIGLQGNLDEIDTLRATFTVQFDRRDGALTGDKAEGNQTKARYWVALSHTGFRTEALEADRQWASAAGLKIAAYDGRCVYLWSGESNTGGMSAGLEDHWTEASEALHWWALLPRYLSSRPSAAEAIADIPDLHLAGREKVGGVECYRLQGTQGETNHTYWLAPDRGYGVKVHQWTYPPPKGGKLGLVRCMWSQTVEEFTEFEGHIWLPTRIVKQFTGFRADGTEYRGHRFVFEAEHVAVNEGVDPGAFHLQFPLSAGVINEQEFDDPPLPGRFGVRKG